MKAKHIIPIIAGGILGTGAAVFAYSEIKRLKEMISAGEEYRKKQGDCIRSLGEVIEEKNEEIAELNRVIYDKDTVIALQEEVIASHEKKVSILKNSPEPSEEPIPATEDLPPPEDSSKAPVQPKIRKQNSQEYIFQYDSDFNLIAKYQKASEATKAVGLKDRKAIPRVLQGRGYTAAGCFWSKGPRPLKKFPEKWIEVSKNMKKWR